MTLYNSFIEELPLILFTVIAQSAVGFSFIYAYGNGAAAQKDERYKKFAIVFLSLVILGMLSSVFHLGDPFHAPYMITRIFGFTQNGNFVISWLPLEILGLGLMVLVGLLVLLKGNKIVIYALPVVGFAMLYAMGNIYGSMSNTIPTWNLSLTLLLFFASALLLGAVTYAAFIAKNSIEHKISVTAMAVGFILFVLALVLYTYHLGSLRLDVMENVFDLTNGNYPILVSLGIILCGISLVLLFMKEKEDSLLPKLAFVLSLVGVFLTRILFYGMITSHIFLG